MTFKYVSIPVTRDAYRPNEVSTVTVAEFIGMLQNFDPELPVILSNDEGYTFGGISDCDRWCSSTPSVKRYEEEDEEEYED